MKRMRMEKWMKREVRKARNALNKATKKRERRKTPYPFGFEYKKEKND